MNTLLEHVEQSIRARKLFRRGDRILVAVSGGVDSMVLLHLLHKLAPKFDWKLTAVHFNHQLRGRASNGDEQFVKRAAKALRLKAVVGRGDVKARSKRNGESVEMAARGMRHEFIARTAKRLRVHSVALAHHAGDQVELFFLRLFRGAGGEGIAGMRWRSPSPVDSGVPLVRPLLDADKSDIETFARESGIRFRNDATNASHDILRNRIRHELLPLITSRYQPAIGRTVLRMMEITGAESECVSDAARRWLKQRRPRGFDRLPVAVQRQCLRLQLLKLNVLPDFEMVEQLRKRMNTAVSVSATLCVVCDSTGLVRPQIKSSAGFNPREIEIAFNGKSGERVFDGVRCRWQVRGPTTPGHSSRRPGSELFDAEKVGSRITLRHWRAGDRFRPIGMSASVKLQDWFTNQKIPRTNRHQVLVAESEGGEIFWVEGQRISDQFKLAPNTRRVLTWKWQRG